MRYDWLGQYLFDSIEELQEFATHWLWTYNHKRLTWPWEASPPNRSLRLPPTSTSSESEKMGDYQNGYPLLVDFEKKGVYSCRYASAEAHTVVRKVDEVENGEMILDIGPKTRAKLAAQIRNTGTIVWNGPIGVFEYAAFADGTKALAIAQSSAYSLAGGGDRLAAIDKFHVADQIDYISTGGGAFLEGKTLPAVAMLETRAS